MTPRRSARSTKGRNRFFPRASRQQNPQTTCIHQSVQRNEARVEGPRQPGSNAPRSAPSDSPISQPSEKPSTEPVPSKGESVSARRIKQRRSKDSPQIQRPPLKRFVLRTHCLALLNVIAANRAAYDTVLHGKTHQSKENARAKLIKALIEASPGARQCFGDDERIEEERGAKMVDILRCLKRKYKEAVSLQMNSSGGGEEDKIKA